MTIFNRIKRKIYKALHPVVGEVWMLHRVVEQRSENLDQRVLEVTPHFLEQKIQEYRQRGYIFISLDDVLRRLGDEGKDSYPPILRRHKGKWVCLTFDDGYQDNYTLAYPLLKRLEVPFAVYVTTGFIDNRLPMWWYAGERLGITTESLKALDAAPLCTIGAHTVSHPKLDTLSKEQQLDEINESKNALEQLLGHPIHHFSFPHGAYNDDTLDICRQLDFHTAVMAWGGPVRQGSSHTLLPRINTVEP